MSDGAEAMKEILHPALKFRWRVAVGGEGGLWFREPYEPDYRVVLEQLHYRTDGFTSEKVWVKVEGPV